MLIRKLTIGLIAINFACAFIITSGIAGWWGVTPQPGISDEAESATQAGQEVEEGASGLADTVTGGMISSLNLVEELAGLMFSGPLLFSNLGVPGWITTFVFGPMYVAALFDFIGIIRGMRLD